MPGIVQGLADRIGKRPSSNDAEDEGGGGTKEELATFFWVKPLALTGLVVGLLFLLGLGLSCSKTTFEVVIPDDDDSASYIVVLESSGQYCLQRFAVDGSSIEIDTSYRKWVDMADVETFTVQNIGSLTESELAVLEGDGR